MAKVSLPRKPKDDKCPKRTLTSYFLYAAEVRTATKAEFPSLPITQIAKEISKKWNVLTEEEKKPYNAEAARLKVQYKVDLQEYQGSEGQRQFKAKLQEWKQECDRGRQAAKKKIQAKKEGKSPKKKSPKKSAKRKKRPKKNEWKCRMILLLLIRIHRRVLHRVVRHRVVRIRHRVVHRQVALIRLPLILIK
eukprot:UN02142